MINTLIPSGWSIIFQLAAFAAILCEAAAAGGPYSVERPASDFSVPSAPFDAKISTAEVPASQLRIDSAAFLATPTASSRVASSAGTMPDMGKQSDETSTHELVQAGHRYYYQGQLLKAVAAYERAIVLKDQLTPGSMIEARLNGAVVWEELGKNGKAVECYKKAAELSPNDPRILTALGWAEWRNKDIQSAETHFTEALKRNPKELYAWIGLGRLKLASKRAREAAEDLGRAAEMAPLNNLAHFLRGQALEASGNFSGAADSFKKAALNDSFFIEARYALGRVLMRADRYIEAAMQFSKVLDADPGNGPLRQLRSKTNALISNGASLRPPETSRSGGASSREAKPQRIEVLIPPQARIPILRVGIGTSPLGRPLPRKALEFQCSTPFSIVDGKTGKPLARGDAREMWQLRFSSRRRSWRFNIFGPDGKLRATHRKNLRIRPDPKRGGTILLYDISYARGYPWAGTASKHLRGEIEISLHPNRQAFKIVNIVDIESYTHGVLSAEMPISSPLETLKVQSVIARSHALYIKAVTRRHRKDGYDVCDEQHCQVYAGAGAETERSRAVVAATRGKIAIYKGKIAHVLYSSNCGGHTQSGNEVSGWGEVPYWKGIADSSPNAPPYPRSPWELRWWLRLAPPAFCMPSSYVYPAHYRWIRVVRAKDLAEKLNRKNRLGKILGIRTLRRSRSGHLNSVTILGGRKDLKLTQEIRIRNLLGLGSQRSALFTLETESGPDGKPETFIFHGGGWGHAVGLCQSGAMGRAEQGQSYEDIIKAYYPGTEISSLDY